MDVGGGACCKHVCQCAPGEEGCWCQTLPVIHELLRTLLPPLQGGALARREFATALSSLGVVLSPKELEWLARCAQGGDSAAPVAYGLFCDAFRQQEQGQQ